MIFLQVYGRNGYLQSVHVYHLKDAEGYFPVVLCFMLLCGSDVSVRKETKKVL